MFFFLSHCTRNTAHTSNVAIPNALHQLYKPTCTDLDTVHCENGGLVNVPNCKYSGLHTQARAGGGKGARGRHIPRSAKHVSFSVEQL